VRNSPRDEKETGLVRSKLNEAMKAIRGLERELSERDVTIRERNRELALLRGGQSQEVPGGRLASRSETTLAELQRAYRELQLENAKLAEALQRKTTEADTAQTECRKLENAYSKRKDKYKQLKGETVR
jgi:hypothetical protein